MATLNFTAIFLITLTTQIATAAQGNFRQIDLKFEPIPQHELPLDQREEFVKAAETEKTFWEIANEAEKEEEAEVHGKPHNFRKIDLKTEPIPEYVGTFPFLTKLDEIPLVSQVDQNYSQKSRAGYYTTADYCRKDWSSVRRMKVNPVALDNLPYDKIQALARRAAIPKAHLERTLNVFAENQSMIPNQRYVGMIDFNKHTSRRRLFILDLKTGEFEGYMLAHGKGSDPEGNGYAKYFSNQDGTEASSLGCAIAGGQAYGENGRKILYLHGFEKTNDEMCDREVVMHPAKYVGWGRSHGCPAIKPNEVDEVYKKLGKGGLLCAYYDGEYMDATDRVRQIKKSKKIYKSKKYKGSGKKSKKSKKKRR